MKYVFLDRDGVINEFPGNGKYVTKVKDFHFIPGVLDALKILTDRGFKIFVISNQAGVSRGIYSKLKLNQITKKMVNGAKKAGAKIQKVQYCIHKSDDLCDCRKPGTGSIERAMASVGKHIDDAEDSFFVGDTKSDILTGYNAKLRTIFVLTGRAKRHHVRKWGIKPDFIMEDLYQATQLITMKNPPKVDRRAKTKVR
ncbi:MAG: HAD-IIIA family hydrolase [Candidatus Zapsychrus exili]|nr:HAD-IIIA family hydrolase [Candidatus Zapsychrus exili]